MNCYPRPVLHDRLSLIRLRLALSYREWRTHIPLTPLSCCCRGASCDAQEEEARERQEQVAAGRLLVDDDLAGGGGGGGGGGRLKRYVDEDDMEVRGRERSCGRRCGRR